MPMVPLAAPCHIPAWLLVAQLVLLIIPSVRMLLWPRQAAN
jgi:hypothetical protein